MDNGYLLVASVDKQYYEAAIKLAESIHDFDKHAKIALFTHTDWVENDERAQRLFYHIDGTAPNSIRAKLWALPQTPFKTTLYIDVDAVVQHEDISTVFDLLGDNDILFTKNRPYNAKITKLSDTEEMIYHCGLFLYNNKPNTLALMNAWNENWHEQQKPEWEHEYKHLGVSPWDTFTMWDLLNNTEFKDTIKVGVFPNPDARWNFVNGYKYSELEGEDIVIYHYTLSRVKPGLTYR